MPYLADKHEKDILAYWEKIDAFKKSVEERPENKPYVFYDGPPFATGLPHYGHILSSVIKDLVPRYKTMKGFRVRRRWGWDCHGLPIEQLVEKELNISGKKDIEEKIGVEQFNETCRGKVLTYTKEWKKMVTRIGRWIEFDNSYKTMDPTYMESVWWALKTIWDKGLVYEGRKVLMYCPRCETPVSKAEVAMDHSYKDVTEESVTVKLKLDDAGVKERFDVDGPTFMLAWTTTPWTLPGNVALAVGKDIEYTILKHDGAYYILAKDRLMHYFGEKEFQVIQQVRGNDLQGLRYEPLYDMPAMRETGKDVYYVALGGFVTTEEGTGVVHTAVVYGEDDYALGRELDLPVVPMLDAKGHFLDIAPEFIRGQYLKKAEKAIKQDLEARNVLFARAKHVHSYPHCWRCDTQLYYNAVSSWFINIQKVKDRMIALNENVNWFPAHLKHGRFLNIMKEAPDWNISRNRYWATALPFWKCTKEDCRAVVCVGSVSELKEKAVNFNEVYGTDDIEQMDLHKHVVDKVRLRCETCKSEMQRVPEVLDSWVEAASMPFAEWHYPFENKDTFEARFPGQYIAEYIAQTRTWFYYMHAIAVLLFDEISFENVVSTGTILNDKGEKLSKSKRNFTDPWVIIEQYGMDTLRYYLMTSVLMQGENLFFQDRDVRDIYNKVMNTLWNVVVFYEMYAPGQEPPVLKGAPTHVLDQWILARLSQLRSEVTEHMDKYDTVRAGRPFKEFIDDLSTWYVRRSRDRFKGLTGEEDKAAAVAVLREVLLTLGKLMAPFTPFIAENMYRAAGGDKESVHLDMWPEAKKLDAKILEEMAAARNVVEMGLSLRKEAGIKVRQPLPALFVNGVRLADALKEIIKDEVNVKDVTEGETDVSGVSKESGGVQVFLSTEITDDLKKEGLLRELVRAINMMRKEQKLTVSDLVVVRWSTDDPLLRSVFEEYADELKRQVLAQELIEEKAGSVTEVEGRSLSLEVR